MYRLACVSAFRISLSQYALLLFEYLVELENPITPLASGGFVGCHFIGWNSGPPPPPPPLFCYRYTQPGPGIFTLNGQDFLSNSAPWFLQSRVAFSDTTMAYLSPCAFGAGSSCPNPSPVSLAAQWLNPVSSPAPVWAASPNAASCSVLSLSENPVASPWGELPVHFIDASGSGVQDGKTLVRLRANVTGAYFALLRRSGVCTLSPWSRWVRFTANKQPPAASFPPYVQTGSIAVVYMDNSPVAVVPYYLQTSIGDSMSTSAFVRLFNLSSLEPLSDDFSPVGDAAEVVSFNRGPAAFAVGNSTSEFGVHWLHSSSAGVQYSWMVRFYSTANPHLKPFPMAITRPILIKQGGFTVAPGSYSTFPGLTSTSTIQHTGPVVRALGLGEGSTLVTNGWGNDLQLHAAFISYANQSTLLDAAYCLARGAPEASMACISSALAGLGSSGHTLRLTAGRWSGCTPGGTLLVPSVTIRGAGSDATLIDCQGVGRAFVVDGARSAAFIEASNVLARASAFQVTIADLTIAHARAATGAGVFVNGTVAGPSVVLEDVTLDNCTATGSAGGGGVALLDAVEVRLTRVTALECSAPAGFGGAVGATYTLADGLLSSNPFAFAHQHGLLFERVNVTGGCSGAGGGGVALRNAPADLPAITITGLVIDSTVCPCESAKGPASLTIESALHPAFGRGAGLLLASLRMPVLELGPAITLIANVNGLGLGGGLAILDVSNVTLVGLTCHSNVAGISSGGCASFVRQAIAVAIVRLVDYSATGNVAELDGGALDASDTSLSFDGKCTLSSNQARLRNGGGLNFVSRSLIPPVSVSVTSASAQLSIRECSAGGNGGAIAQFGGAITISAVATLQLHGNLANANGGGLFSTFGGTMSLSGNGSSLTSNRADIAGGAVFVCLLSTSCGAPTCSTATASLALVNATRLVLRPGVVLTGNSAGRFGPTLASDATSMKLTTPLTALSNPRKLYSGTTLWDDSTEQAVISLTDVFGQPTGSSDMVVLAESSSSTSSSAGDAAGAALSGASSCTPFEASGCALNPFVNAIDFASLESGRVYSYNAVLVRAECLRVPDLARFSFRSCPAGSDTVNGTAGVRCVVSCAAGAFLAPGTAEAPFGNCSDCQPGSFMPQEQHTSNDCLACGAGLYSYAAERACLPCPTGGDCGPSGAYVAPARGHWWPSGSSESFAASKARLESFLRCRTDDACPGSRTSFSSCGSGYRAGSFLCAKCADDYAHVGFECRACWPRWATVLLTIVIVSVVLIGLSFFIVRASNYDISAQPAPGAARASRGALMKVLMTYLQLLALILSFNSQNNPVLQRTLGTLSSFGGLSVGFYSFQCVRPTSFGMLLAFTLITPLLAAAWALILAAATKFFDKKRVGAVETTMPDSGHADGRKPLRSARAGMTQTLVIVLFLVYPGTATTVLRTFQCTSFAGQAHRRLQADLDVECYQPAHMAMVVGALAGLLLYVVGIPLAGFAYLSWKKRRHERLGLDYSLFVASNRFFLESFRSETWWFEFVILIRKVVLVVIVVFVSNSMAQMYFGATLMALSLVLLTHLRPYQSVTLNAVESTMHQLALFTLCAAIVFSNSAAAGYVNVAVVLTLAANGAFFAWMTRMLLVAGARPALISDTNSSNGAALPDNSDSATPSNKTNELGSSTRAPSVDASLEMRALETSAPELEPSKTPSQSRGVVRGARVVAPAVPGPHRRDSRSQRRVQSNT